MTRPLARLYGLVTGVLVFFLAWAGVAAHPWAAPRPTQDPQVAALAVRQQQLQARSVRVQKIVAARWAQYRRKVAANQQVVARQPSVRVVNLPPLVVTRTS